MLELIIYMLKQYILQQQTSERRELDIYLLLNFKSEKFGYSLNKVLRNASHKS